MFFESIEKGNSAYQFRRLLVIFSMLRYWLRFGGNFSFTPPHQRGAVALSLGLDTV